MIIAFKKITAKVRLSIADDNAAPHTEPATPDENRTPTFWVR